MDFPHDPDSFVPHGEVAEYFENYAKMIDAPIETGVEVQNIVKNKNKKALASPPVKARFLPIIS